MNFFKRGILRRLGQDKTAAFVFTLALTLEFLMGLSGIQWGLPAKSRFAAFPSAMLNDPAMPQKLESSWKAIYAGFDKAHIAIEDEQAPHIEGVKEFPAGWSWPPGDLVHSYRSILLRSESPDEQKTFTELSRMNPAKFNFKPLYVHYGGFFIYSTGALLELASRLRLIHLNSSIAYYLVHPGAMRRLYLVGRALIFLSTLATLFVLFDIGKRMSGAQAGALAALIFVLCPAVIPNSHILKPHPYAALWALLSIDAALAALEGESRGAFRLCGAFAGMAAGSNLSFFYFGALPLFSWFWKKRPQSLLRAALEGSLISFFIFALSNPYLFLDPRYYMWELLVYPRHHAMASLSSGFVFFTRYFPDAIGLGVAVLSVLGLIFAFIRGGSRRFIAAVFAGGFLILWVLLAFVWGFLDSPISIRFFYPFLGLASLLAADFLVGAPLPKWTRVFLALAVLSWNSITSFVYLRNLGLNDGPLSTRRQAASWIEKNISPGTSLGLGRYPQPYSTPLFRYDRYRLTVFARADFLKPASLPKFIVLAQEDYVPSKRFLKKYYDPAAFFKPFSIFGASMDDSYYINTPIWILRRK